jgi:predicted transcriptional regulator
MNIKSINIFKKGTQKSLGDLEGEIMEVLWKSAEPMSARGVTDSLKKKVTFNAVSTVLNRLQEKSIVTKIANGKRYCFQPTINKQEYSRSILSSGLTSLLSDKQLLSAAGITGGNTKGLDPEAIKLLKQFIDKHEG